MEGICDRFSRSKSCQDFWLSHGGAATREQANEQSYVILIEAVDVFILYAQRPYGSTIHGVHPLRR
jgi:hypothetical protein